MINSLEKKGYQIITPLIISALFAIPAVALDFATVVNIFPRHILFTLIFPMLTSSYIGLLTEELFDVIKVAVCCVIFFFLEILIVLNLPVLIGIIGIDSNLWIFASFSLTLRLTLVTGFGILIGSFLGVGIREYKQT